MQFNSYVFVLAFLPITALLYFLSNYRSIKMGKFVIIVASFIFYAYTDISVAKILIVSCFINYFFSSLMKRFDMKKKFFFVLPVLINICLLIYYKYTNFLITNFNQCFSKDFQLKDIVLPIGISFFTFQQISYCISIYNGTLGLNIIDYFAYILYFPKILMGPLMDPLDFSQQINDVRRKKVDWENVSNGLKIFSLGLFKKLLLADTFAKAVDWGIIHVDTASSMDILLVMLFYTFEIYFDFSGYCDMATGASLIFNIMLPINFDSPYKAMSIRDFWKRWHISLTNFLTRNVYIPLGGSRKGVVRTCINTLVVFVISGIWHGANWTFILWGVLHGLFSVFDRIFEKVEKKVFEPVRWFLTFGIINLLWLLFRAQTIQQWVLMIKKILFFTDLNISSELISIFKIDEIGFLCNKFYFINAVSEKVHGFWLMAFVLIAYVICLIPENNYKRIKKNSYIEMFFAAILFVWAFLSLGSESVFVYFGF
ncbi:MAG: MBOAT family protein [Lachnospiraceae bacterium]|nr:MBOAT family protein [Lachnospiraceae bacterium]